MIYIYDLYSGENWFFKDTNRLLLSDWKYKSFQAVSGYHEKQIQENIKHQSVLCDILQLVLVSPSEPCHPVLEAG